MIIKLNEAGDNMRLSKKLLSVLLAFAVLVIALPLSGISSYAADTSEFTYQVLSEEDKTAEITSYTGAGGDVVIPETLDGYTVTSLGDTAFGEEENGYMNFSITSLTIPQTIENISETASICLIACGEFIVDEDNVNFSSLCGVLFNKNKHSLIRYPSGKNEISYTVPSSVTEICYGAFYFSKLKSIDVSNGVETVVDYAFSYSSELEEVKFADTVVYLGEGAFDSCESLKTVILSNSLTTINGYVFYGCRSLTEIIIPSSVTSIDTSAFMGSHLAAVYGVPGSYAETYANENGYEFIDINELTIPGDMNGDAVCDLNDIDIMLQISAGVTEPSSVQLKLGDLNDDGVIDGFDVAKLDILISSDASE